MPPFSRPELLAALIDPEALYQNAPCGYLSYLEDGTIITLNATLLSWLGYAREEVVGKLKLEDLFSKGGRIYYQMFHYPLILLKGQVKEINYDIFRKDGSSFPALVNSVSIKNDDGRLLAVNLVINDISDRKKYELELLHAKQLADSQRSQFEFVSDFIPEMIWTADANGHINYINKRFLSHFELPKQNISEFAGRIYPEDRSAALRSWIKSIRLGEEFQIQLRLKNYLNQYNWYLLKGTPFRENNGEISKWLGSCLNINAHIEELERRDEFLTVASHELKTPLTSLKATLQILDRASENDISEKYRDLVTRASNGMAKISTLIDDLLNVKQLNSGQLILDKSNFNLSAAAENCWNSLNNDGKFQLKFSGERDVKVLADEHRIEQVIINFMGNAIKYAPQSRSITVDITKNAECVKFSVIDDGPGIHPDQQSHLFERYYRADHKGSQYSGLGLGLYISAEIIKRHAGRIGVDSQPGNGSSFWFTLPI